MKRLLATLSCAAAIFMVGCTNDLGDDTLQLPSADAISINIDGDISQTYTTRVNDGGFCAGDAVGLYGVNYTDDNATQGALLSSGNQVDNAKYTLDATTGKWVATGDVYYKDVNTNIDLYAYYPYGKPEDVNAYGVELYADQSGAGLVDGYALSDFLWGKVENVTPSESAVRIKYSHRMAGIRLQLVAGNNWADEATFAAAIEGATVLNTTRQAEVDLATGYVTAVGEATGEGTIMRATAEGYRAIVVPQSMAAATALFAITVDGITYRYKAPEELYFEGGKLTSFTVQINRKEFSGDVEFELVGCEIVDWIADLESHGGEARQYYVVHVEEPGTLGDLIVADGKNPAKIKNLKVSGNIGYNDFRFMRDEMEILQAVNLKESKIVGYTWFYYTCIDGIYRYEYFSGEVPASTEEARAAVMARYPDATISWNGWGETSEYPDDVIPSSAFSGKSSLVYFVFPEKVTKIGGSAFQNTMLSGALVIPNDVVEIGNYAFSGTFITSLELPTGLKTLGSYAFSDCQVLSGTLALPAGLKSIGDYCFNNCSSLTGELIIPEGLTTIPGDCFRECSNLTGDLIIPEGVTSIGGSAFFNCSGFNGQLVLPESLKTLEGYAFYCCNFQGELVIPSQITEIPDEHVFNGNDFTSIVLPEGLLRIGNGAFSNCSKISEPVVIPSTVTSIGKNAFYYCYNIPAITIGKNVAVIQSDAFYNCKGLQAITSNATTPPTAMSGAFSYVPKDAFIVGVPAESVVKYQTANQWSEFQYSAHYDFTLDRTDIAELNSGNTTTVALNAPSAAPWEVTSCPEWITVYPASGNGPTAVQITVADLEAGSGDRTGEIVFTLTGKEYSTTLPVTQKDNTEYAEYTDGEVITNQTASIGGGVDIVFMGEAFTAEDIADGTYKNAMDTAIEHFFGVEPYTTYRDYFNVYTVVAQSAEKGVSTEHHHKNNKFGSKHNKKDGVIEPNFDTIFEYAQKAPIKHLWSTLIVLVVNNPEYDGVTYLWEDGTTVCICPMTNAAYPYDFRGIIQHEAGGHGFGKLADELVNNNSYIQQDNNKHNDFNNGKHKGWYKNLSESGNMNKVPWSHFLTNEEYQSIVDLYEGGYYYAKGIYRSEATSCMDNNIPYFNAISRQAIVERIMEYAGEEFDQDDFYKKDKKDAGKVDKAPALTRSAGTESYPKNYGHNAPKLMSGAPEL